MIIKLLGIADILAALLFFISSLFNLSNNIVLIIGIYLIIKGLIFVFMFDFASMIDILCGGIIITALTLTIHPIITGLICFYLIQKGILSLISN